MGSSSLRKGSLRLALAAGLIGAGLLAGCSGGGGGDSGTVITPTPPPVAAVDRFGTCFATAYRADPNSTPVDPPDGCIIPISLTAEPIEPA